MGLIYDASEEWETARKYYEVNVNNRVEAVQSYVYLAEVYRDLKMYRKAQEVYELYIEGMGDNARVRVGLAGNYADQGEFDLALEELDKAAALSPENYQIIMNRGEILLAKGDLEKAEAEYQKLMIDSEPIARVSHMVHICGLYVYQGRFQEAKRQLELGKEMAERIGEEQRARSIRDYLAFVYWRTGDYAKAVELEDEIIKEATGEENFGRRRTSLWHKGFLLAEMNRLDEARQAAEEIRSMVAIEMNTKLIRGYHHVWGWIELKRGNFALAIGQLKLALDLYPYPQSFGRFLFADPLAKAYYQNGDLENARRAYEDIVFQHLGRHYAGDIYVRSFYWLGKIWEQKGDAEKAVGYYEKFLSFWKGADPGLPEVEDARKRLAGLKGS